MNEKSPPMAAHSDSSEGVDVLGLFQRHYPIILLCSFLSALMGIAYCCFTEEVYESKAEILIKQKHSPAFNDQTIKDRTALAMENELETHRLVVSSPMIIERATKEFQLDKLGVFQDAGKSTDTGVLDYLKNLLPRSDAGSDSEALTIADIWEEKLVVEVPDKEACVLDIRFRSNNPDDCYQVVNGIVKSYESHLGEASSNLGKEITNLILRGKDELRGQLKAQEDEYAAFQKSAPLLWREGQGINIFQERQDEIEEKRRSLLVEKSMLESKIRGVTEAVARGGESLEAVYYEALMELRGTDDEDTVKRESTRGFSMELAKDYMQLLASERAMRNEYGAGHPELIALRARLKELRGAVENSMGRKLRDGVAIDMDENEIAHPEYVGIYLRMLMERGFAFDIQLKTLDADFRIATKEAQQIQEFIAKDKSYRADQERTEKLFDAVVARLEEINIIQDYGGETMQVIATPTMGQKVWPSLPIVIVLSTMLGGLIGCAWALLRELTLRVFTDPQEVRQVLQAPVLGQVPFQRKRPVSERFETLDPGLGVLHDSDGRFAEAFRGIRTALHFTTNSSDSQVFQVTSPTPGDGKSMTAANLASTIASSHKKVVLVDADMRKPTVHKLFGVDRSGGLKDLLGGHAQLKSVIKETIVENLDVITSGGPTDNPAELLTLESFDSLLDTLKLQYDVVIVDSPPLLAVSDPSIIAPRVDGVVLVIRIREKVRAATEKARDILNEVGATILGATVNGIAKGRSGFGYGDSSRYGYVYRSGYSYGYGYKGSEAYYGEQDSRDDSPKSRNGVVHAPEAAS